MLKILDSTKEAFGNIVDFEHEDPLRMTHDGKLGGSYEQLIYIKNDDATLYYTNVSLSPVSSNYDDIASEWGETGFGLKLLYGERRPTETEWDQVKSGEAIMLPDIGTTDAADIANYFPVWVRTVCPGLTPAQIKTNLSIKLSYRAKNLGT